MKGRRPMPLEVAKAVKRKDKIPKEDLSPEPEKGIPEMPLWLKAFSLAVENWEREARILDDMGVLTEADFGVLADRCYLYSQKVQLALDIMEEGRTVGYIKMDSLGNEITEWKHNPKVKQLEVITNQYLKCGSLLGLDPAYRGKLTVSKKKKPEKEGFGAL